MTDRRRLPVLLVAVLSTFTAQQVLTPVLAPLAREIGLTEVALGSVVTVAAVVFAGTALLWGKAVDRFGRRPVLLLGMALALIGLSGFAVVSQLTIVEALDTTSAYVLILATRSILFGAGLGAVPVAAIALIAASTEGDADRTRGIGQIGAAQGLALVLGPALGGLLSVAGLLGPIWLAPALLLVMLVVVAVLLPREPARAAAPDTERPPALRPWDGRLWPVLAAGFLLYLALALLQIVLGFLLQDRLELDSASTVAATGTVFVVCGVVLILVQGVVVPRLRWPAARLLRVGAPIALAGTLALLPANALWAVVAAMGLLAVGLGLAMPGFATAPTLLVGPEEQGGVAGLVQAVTGLTFVIGPIAGTGLYELLHQAPVVAAAIACAAATVFVLLHPALRAAPRRAVTTVGS
nr:MFS transporter [Pseudonocardia sp. TRM90224]